MTTESQVQEVQTPAAAEAVGAVVEPAAPPPVVQQQPEDAPRSRREARKQSRDISRQRLGTEQKSTARDPQGRFASEAEPETDPPEAGGEPVVEEPTAQAAPEGGQAVPKAEGATTAAPEAPKEPQTVRIPLPEGDLRRAAGISPEQSELEVPKHLEQFARWGIKTAKRLTQVQGNAQQLESRLSQAEERLMQYEAREAAEQKWPESQTFQEFKGRYDQLKRAEELGDLPEGTSESYKHSVAPHFQKLVEDELQSRRQVAQTENMQREAERFRGDAWQRAMTDQRIPEEIRRLPQFSDSFNKSYVALDTELIVERQTAQRMGQQPRRYTSDELHQKFGQILGRHLTGEPQVRQVLQGVIQRRKQHQDKLANDAQEAKERAERDKAKAAQDAVKGFTEGASNARRAAPPHPMGSLQRAATDGGVMNPEPQGEQLPRTLSPQQTRKAARSGIGGLVDKYTNQRR